MIISASLLANIIRICKMIATAPYALSYQTYGLSLFYNILYKHETHLDSYWLESTKFINTQQNKQSAIWMLWQNEYWQQLTSKDGWSDILPVSWHISRDLMILLIPSWKSHDFNKMVSSQISAQTIASIQLCCGQHPNCLHEWFSRIQFFKSRQKNVLVSRKILNINKINWNHLFDADRWK